MPILYHVFHVTLGAVSIFVHSVEQNFRYVDGRWWKYVALVFVQTHGRGSPNVTLYAIVQAMQGPTLHIICEQVKPGITS